MMKKFLITLLLLGLMVIFQGGEAFAVLTPISLSPDSPVAPFTSASLLASSGILDTIYGLSNIVRINDDYDKYWEISGSTGTATAQAKFAGNKQYLYAGSQFLFAVTGVNGFLNGSPNAIITEPGSFKFYDDPTNTTGLPGNPPPKWSSLPSENVAYSEELAGLDRMVTFKIVNNIGKSNNVIGNYVMAWEDLNDNDYNDIVYEFSGIKAIVPEPTTMLLFGMGILGLYGVGKRRKA